MKTIRTIRTDIHRRLGDFYFRFAGRTGRVIEVRQDSDGEDVYALQIPQEPVAIEIPESELTR